MNRPDVPWLKLVYDSLEIPSFSEKVDTEIRQLSFPFPEPDIIVVLDVAQFHYVSFKSALDQIKPKWIFDIRAAPRMDRLVGGRSHAFREFERIGSRYIDIFGIVGLTNYKKAIHNPGYWTPVVEEFISSSLERRGPYLALLDDDIMINSVSRHFASSVSHATGREVSLSRLDAEML
ncbi:hypothetical protein [Sphingomonas sp. R86521]|uniref:hypothetical protein n=1 Tax=Sphingomonas sp. R86521 TaxID=3093860 RepID=UPI0036D38DE7